MNKSQENLLSFIKGNPNLTSNEISVKTGIAFKTVANNITWLVGEKLIVREMVDKKFRYSVKSAKPEKIKKEKPIKKEKTVSEKKQPC